MKRFIHLFLIKHDETLAKLLGFFFPGLPFLSGVALCVLRPFLPDQYLYWLLIPALVPGLLFALCFGLHLALVLSVAILEPALKLFTKVLRYLS